MPDINVVRGLLGRCSTLLTCKNLTEPSNGHYVFIGRSETKKAGRRNVVPLWHIYYQIRLFSEFSSTESGQTKNPYSKENHGRWFGDGSAREFKAAFTIKTYILHSDKWTIPVTNI